MKHSLKLVAALLVATFVMSVTGCNTTKGVGTDIEKAGEGLKKSAERNGAN